MNNLKVKLNNILVLCLFFMSTWLQGQEAANELKKETVKSLADRVRNYQNSLGLRFKNQHWVRGTYYAGLMALYESTGDKVYLNDCLAWGKKVSWRIKDKGDNRYDSGAYSLICGQIWYECYLVRKKEEMIQPTIDFLNNPKYTNPLSKPLDWYFENTGHRFVDGLFTGPPALAMLYQKTGDEKYINWMDACFWDNYGALYDTESKLFYRGQGAIGRRTRNDKKVFWARGNGWAYGGLVRILKYLPKDHPSYGRYKAVFIKMSESLLTSQQEDGFWRSNLDDPNHHKMKESSGTSFFCYGIAWGVNNGILDRKLLIPCVKKSWKALSSIVNDEGVVTWNQPPAGGPGKTQESDSTRYGAGIFLLAASEVIRLAN